MCNERRWWSLNSKLLFHHPRLIKFYLFASPSSSSKRLGSVNGARTTAGIINFNLRNNFPHFICAISFPTNFFARSMISNFPVFIIFWWKIKLAGKGIMYSTLVFLTVGECKRCKDGCLLHDRIPFTLRVRWKSEIWRFLFSWDIIPRTFIPGSLCSFMI